VHSYLTFRTVATICLAWLVLVFVAPVPGVMSVAVGSTGGDDFTPENPSLAENEMLQDEGVLPETHLKRTCGSGRLALSSALHRSPQAKSASQRLWGSQPGSRFLFDGRSLRIQIRSLTC
jgi:hypothetical protein